MSALPVPTPRGEENRWFEDVRQGRLPIYRCAACQVVRAHPFARCLVCGGEAERAWSSGEGAVASFTVVARAGHPAFFDRVPYVIGLVDLDEKVRLLADLRGRDGATAGQWRIGDRVRVGFETRDDGWIIPFFEWAS